MLYFLMMVDSGKEKPGNDTKGHHGWYLPGSTWKGIKRAVRKTRRSLIVPERRSRKAWWEGLVGRIKDTVRSSRSSGPPGPEQTRPPAPGPCACFGRRSVTLRPFWLPEPQLLLTSGLLRPGVSDLGLRPSCAHIYGGRVPVKQRLEHPKPVVGRESGCYKRRVRPAPCG